MFKEKLKERYWECEEKEHAKLTLRNVRQKDSENVQDCLVDTMVKLAKRAFGRD